MGDHRCPVCLVDDRWAGGCACDEQAAAVERIPELEAKIESLREALANVSRCSGICGECSVLIENALHPEKERDPEGS